MDRIEFIGAYYVGKSTLYEAYCNQIDLSTNCIVDKDIRRVARNKIGEIKFWYRSLLSRIFQVFGGSLSVYNIPNINALKTLTLEKYKYTLSLCFQDKTIVSENYSLVNKTFLRLLNIIAQYEFYDTLSTNKVLLTEESIIHWHQVLHELLLHETFVFSEDQLDDKGFFPRALIYCYADSKVIFERIKKRQNDKLLNVPDRNQGLDQVLEKVLLKQEVLLKYTQIAEKNGVGVLHINTGKPISDNITKINEFLQGL